MSILVNCGCPRAGAVADPYKLQLQIARFGASTAGMPPPWVYEASDGVLVLYNGMTRASSDRQAGAGDNDPCRGRRDVTTGLRRRAEDRRPMCHDPGDPARADREARRTPAAIARCPVRPVAGQPRISSSKTRPNSRSGMSRTPASWKSWRSIVPIYCGGSKPTSNDAYQRPLSAGRRSHSR